MKVTTEEARAEVLSSFGAGVPVTLEIEDKQGVIVYSVQVSSLSDVDEYFRQVALLEG
jgi:hypothetical protein